VLILVEQFNCPKEFSWQKGEVGAAASTFNYPRAELQLGVAVALLSSVCASPLGMSDMSAMRKCANTK